MKNYVYGKFSGKGTMTLTIEGLDLSVVQFSSSFAANEIPTASLLLPLGRDVRTRKASDAHKLADIKTMVKATVTFKPEGEYSLRDMWPTKAQVIFDGYYGGFAYQKVNGKASIVVQLVHWLVGLTFSSALTSYGHVANPTWLNYAAVFDSLNDAGGGQGAVVASLALSEVAISSVTADLWVAIKSVFCSLAQNPGLAVTAGSTIGCGVAFTKNTTALNALRRIEGDAGSCVSDPDETDAEAKINTTTKYSVPLALEGISLPPVAEVVAQSIGNEMLENYSGVTFWDKLIGQFCPDYGIAVVPMVSTAIVVADTPTYNKAVWREIATHEYAEFNFSAEQQRPLRAVGVMADYDSVAGAGIQNQGQADPVLVGGCFIPDTVDSEDGTVLYIKSPSWLRMAISRSNLTPQTTGLDSNTPGTTATTPDATPEDMAGTIGGIIADMNPLYKKCAETFYALQMLRGRQGTISGKLRFDIAPLSIVKIRAASERFVGGEDSLAATLYGCVQRVTIGINAESGMAGTTLFLSHLRTQAENTDPRTSTEEHPLFGSSIHGKDKDGVGRHGSPLVEAYEFQTNDDGLSAGDGPVHLGGPVA